MLESFIDKIDDIEEAVDRFVSTSEEFYDKNLHEYIMSETRDLINNVRDSEMAADEKSLAIGLITAVLEFASIDVKIFTKNKHTN